MFNNLTTQLSTALAKIRGKGCLTEDNIKSMLREVRIALLEADVTLYVVKEFINQVRKRAIGTEVTKNLTTGQAMIKIVRSELEKSMGQAAVPISLATVPPAVILLAGLQGAGKTTSVVKLAKYLQQQEKKKVLVVSTDIYRPAAIEQLEILAKETEVDFYPSHSAQSPKTIAAQALNSARKKLIDVVIVDTAGRTHIDQDMMDEIKELHQQLLPVETLFVADAMTGQAAAKTAKAFNQVLSITGTILTKVDGDARGGAALSIRHVTGKPIKFLGVGEKTDALDVFHPDRIASRILGMGDALSLIEDIERKVDQKQATKLVKKIQKGKKFDLEDFKQQLTQINKMGGITSMLDKLPSMGKLTDTMQQFNPTTLAQPEVIINSMTLQERHYPELIKGSRKKRIAAGSGKQIQDVNRLLKQFFQMQKMMKKLPSSGGMRDMMGKMHKFMPKNTDYSRQLPAVSKNRK